MISVTELLLHADQPIISDKMSSNDMIALLNAKISVSSIYLYQYKYSYKMYALNTNVNRIRKLV